MLPLSRLQPIRELGPDISKAYQWVFVISRFLSTFVDLDNFLTCISKIECRSCRFCNFAPRSAKPFANKTRCGLNPSTDNNFLLFRLQSAGLALTLTHQYDIQRTTLTEPEEMEDQWELKLPRKKLEAK